MLGKVTETFMASAERSLRLMVEHWLVTDPGQQVKVTELKNRRSKRERYVYIQVNEPTRSSYIHVLAASGRYTGHIPTPSRIAIMRVA